MARVKGIWLDFADWRRVTVGLSPAEKGAYVDLIIACAENEGRLENDTKLLHMSSSLVTRIWNDFLRRHMKRLFYQAADGCWRSETVDFQLERAEKISEARQAAGQSGAQARWQKPSQTDGKSMANAMPIAMANATLKYESMNLKEKEEAPTGAQKKAARLVGEPAPRLSHPPSEKKNGAGRGERLPIDWQPDDEDCGYARERGLDPAEQASAFRDIWNAKVGVNARKLDWKAAWRTWCRREVASRHRHGDGSTRSASDRPGITSFTSALRRAFPDVN